MDMKELSSILQQNGIVGAGGAGLYLPAVLQADEVDAQDAGIGAEDAAYSEQVQGQDGSGFQGGHEP